MGCIRTALGTIGIFIFCSGYSQGITREQWDQESKNNIRLLPKYGNNDKSRAQKKADKEFIAKELKLNSTRRQASEKLINLGFQYLYRDARIAMYRFNQAYLVDSTNSDIYWGFGGVYMILGDYERAAEQYQQGLKVNPQNSHLLTDYGTYYLAKYFVQQPKDKELALSRLDSAIQLLTDSYNIDKYDPNTTYKLSICYRYKGDCARAWNYYDICMGLGGKPITKEYTDDLEINCQRRK